MNIIVHGSLAFDRIKNFPGYFRDNILPDRIHNLSVSFYIESVEEKRGGTGGNIVYNLALLGERPKILASVGREAVSYIEFLKERNVDVSLLNFNEDAMNSMCDIITDKANNQITAFFVGASGIPTNVDFTKLDRENTIVSLSPANNKADSLKYGKMCKELGITHIFDPGQMTPEYSKEELLMMIDGSALFTVNDYELELVKAKTGLTADEIAQRTDALVITLGAKGSAIKTRSNTFKIHGFMQDKMVDPTGAGDAYRAGLLKGLTLGLSLEDTGRLAACAASFAIEHHGTQEHAYTHDQFCERYKQYFDQECPLS
ncbi:MAG: carbohydrate kinase family protein [Candidatus Kerfeldbacteria bacterium]|nr:carbohydrate kinase family protein [Candidatus Kerfeldbacteria bacterium]